MKSHYAITIDDAGLTDQELNVHWEARESPNEFVSWLGRKYDLTIADSAHPYFPRSIPLKQTLCEILGSLDLVGNEVHLVK